MLAAMNSAAMNMDVGASLWHADSEHTTYTVAATYCFFWNLHTDFHSCGTRLKAHHGAWVAPFPHPHQNCVFLHDRYADWMRQTLNVILLWNFIMVKNIEEYIFKCLLNNLISSTEKYIFNLLAHSMIKCFWRNIIFGVLYRLEIPVRQIAGKAILPSWNCLFSLLKASLSVQIFNFVQYHLWILKVSPMPLEPFSESPYLCTPERVLPVFSLSSFRLSSFTSRLLIQ